MTTTRTATYTGMLRPPGEDDIEWGPSSPYDGFDVPESPYGGFDSPYSRFDVPMSPSAQAASGDEDSESLVLALTQEFN